MLHAIEYTGTLYPYIDEFWIDRGVIAPLPSLGGSRDIRYLYNDLGYVFSSKARGVQRAARRLDVARAAPGARRAPPAVPSAAALDARCSRFH